MSQPHHSEHFEPDSLLAFVEERQLSGKTPDPAVARPVEDAGDVQRRLERAERQIERALIAITTLKSDLATIVSAVDDIKKRMSRLSAPPAPVVALPSRKAPSRRAMATVVVLMMTGAAAWGLMSVAVDDVPEPPAFAKGSGEAGSAIERETSSAPEPLPVVESPPQVPVLVQAPTRRVVAARAAPASVNYVGTLTVDAEPAGDVWVDRQTVGRTPVRLENLRAGSHLVWIEREGYRRWTRVVAVAADRISRVSASLDPISR